MICSRNNTKLQPRASRIPQFFTVYFSPDYRTGASCCPDLCKKKKQVVMNWVLQDELRCDAFTEMSHAWLISDIIAFAVRDQQEMYWVGFLLSRLSADDAELQSSWLLELQGLNYGSKLHTILKWDNWNSRRSIGTRRAGGWHKLLL